MQISQRQDFVAATSVTWLCDQNHRTVRSGSLTSRLRTTAGILGENAAHEEQREETVSVARREIRTGIDALFLPDSVAVIGATERTGTVGRTVLENLLRPSFRGKVFAVNSRHSEICGLKAYPTVADIPEKVDL